jgi:hypothetical protein
MKNFNNWLAIKINDNVGTMYCGYLFAVIGIMGVVAALTSNTKFVLIVGSISGYFLQLVLLPIIMVAGKIQSNTTTQHIDKRHNELKKHISDTLNSNKKEKKK